LIEEALGEYAINFFADTAVLAVDEVVEGGAVGETDPGEVAEAATGVVAEVNRHT